MEIIYSSSDSYARIAAVSIASLCENNREADAIHIHVIGNRIRPETRNKLVRLAESYARQLDVLELPDLNRLAGVEISSRQYNIATFARLCLGLIFPTLERVIFIDCDTLVLGSLQALWETPLRKGMLMAGTLDAVSRVNRRRIGLSADATYINVGVLLADLSRWREAEIHNTFFTFLRQRNGSVPIVDQGVINATASEYIQPLPAEYNVMTFQMAFSYREMKRYKKPRNYYDAKTYESVRIAPTILHATNQFLLDRPWVEGSNYPYAERWRGFCANTPWADEPLEPNRLPAHKKVLRALCKTPLRRMVLEALGVVQASVKM
jgi:lipopolysaccharide biosynthesis glycosyltransferase